jgi:hypothetical protein
MEQIKTIIKKIDGLKTLENVGKELHKYSTANRCEGKKYMACINVLSFDDMNPYEIDIDYKVVVVWWYGIINDNKYTIDKQKQLVFDCENKQKLTEMYKMLHSYVDRFKENNNIHDYTLGTVVKEDVMPDVFN